MTYRDTITNLSEQAEAQAVMVYESWQEGLIDDAEFVALLAAIVTAANSQAAALADLSLAATITVALQRPVPTMGLHSAAGDGERLTKAATTLLAVSDLTPERVARLARAEPLTTAARTYSEGIKRSPHVTGWTRGVSGSACQLCRWWHREGRVWPADHAMPTHKGCSCSQVPTIRDNIKPVRSH